MVNNTTPLPAVVCVQRKAPKCVPTEDDLMESNIKSFGNAVGEVTNKITSMFEVQSRFPKGSREYRILDYRIKCGQLYQQNTIDATKGIEAKPMPDKWYSWISNKISKGNNSKEKKENWMNRYIVADKKPYFMKYIYPSEKSNLNEYIKRNNEKCLMRFRITLDELLNKKNKSKEEQIFEKCYYQRMPLGTAPCTINKICWRIEELFDDKLSFKSKSNFNYSILKSTNVEYSQSIFRKIKKIYIEYKAEAARYSQYAKSERIKSDDRQIQKYILKDTFKRKCLEQCPNEEMLCNIVLDLCYSSSKSSKQFAWDICGDMFIQNLLKRNHYIIHYPKLDDDGDITFEGNCFSMTETEIKVNIDIDTEDDICQLY